MVTIQSFSNFAASFFTQSIQPSLAMQKKKILLIVSLAFACLAALYVLRHRCFKGTVQNRKEEGLGIEVKEEKQNDRRKIVYPDGIIEEGIFIEGQLTGQGTRTYPDGEKEEGEFKFGRLNGPGKRTTSDGGILKQTEVGDFISGKLHGQGKKTLSNGTVLEGTFENGVFDGCLVDSQIRDLILKYLSENDVEKRASLWSSIYVGLPSGKLAHRVI